MMIEICLKLPENWHVCGAFLSKKKRSDPNAKVTWRIEGWASSYFYYCYQGGGWLTGTKSSSPLPKKTRFPRFHGGVQSVFWCAIWRPIKQRLFQLKIALSPRTWSNCEGCLVKERDETKEFPSLPKTLHITLLRRCLDPLNAFSRRDLGVQTPFDERYFGRANNWDLKQNEKKLNSDFMAIPLWPFKRDGSRNPSNGD